MIRREMAKLDYEAKRTIKGHRFVFMRNEENLDAKGQRILGELRASGIFEMCQMANMVEKHLEGITTVLSLPPWACTTAPRSQGHARPPTPSRHRTGGS